MHKGLVPREEEEVWASGNCQGVVGGRQQWAPGPAFPWTEAFLDSGSSICQGEGLDPLGPPGIRDSGTSTLLGGQLLMALNFHLPRS